MGMRKQVPKRRDAACLSDRHPFEIKPSVDVMSENADFGGGGVLVRCGWGRVWRAQLLPIDDDANHKLEVLNLCDFKIRDFKITPEAFLINVENRDRKC